MNFDRVVGKKIERMYISEDYPHDYIIIEMEDGSVLNIEYDWIYDIRYFEGDDNANG